MTKVEAAWLAGFIDGEGCLSAHEWQGNYILSYMYIFNTNVSVIKYIAQLTGGHISVTNKATSKHKEGLKVGLYGKSMLPVLTQIYPFLRIKQRQAQLIVKLLKIQASSTRSHRDVSGQYGLMRQLQALNRKGPPK